MFEQAEHFHEERRRQRGRWYDWVEKESILRAVKPKAHQTIWDAGCGGGGMARTLARKCKKLFATDFSEKSIEVLRSLSRREGIDNVFSAVANVSDAPGSLIAHEKFDSILCSQVIQHIPDAQKRLQTVQYFFERLKINGKCVLVLNNWDSQRRTGLFKEEVSEQGQFFLRYTALEAYELMRMAGFTKISVRGLVNIPGIHRLRNSPAYRILGPLARLDVLFSRIGLSARVGEFLIVTGRKP